MTVAALIGTPVRSEKQAEEYLLTLLQDKNYAFLVHLINRDYGNQFRTEQSGEAFEDCVDWCAQNAGGIENAKLVLLELFAKFFHQLPMPVRDNLAYLAEEIGFSLSRPNLAQLKDRSKDRVSATKTAFNVMVKQVQDYVAEIRRRPEPQVSVRFHEPMVVAARRMERNLILDVQDVADAGDNPCRAGGPQTTTKLRKSA